MGGDYLRGTDVFSEILDKANTQLYILSHPRAYQKPKIYTKKIFGSDLEKCVLFKLFILNSVHLYGFHVS